MPAEKVKLKDVLTSTADRITFNYDFGDNWEVALKMVGEESLPSAKGLPRVLDGAGFGIIENCGGPTDLAELNAMMESGDIGPFSNYLPEFLLANNGLDFDLADFDIQEVNFRLKKLVRYYKQLYEDDKEISNRGMALLMHDYSDRDFAAMRQFK